MQKDAESVKERRRKRRKMQTETGQVHNRAATERGRYGLQIRYRLQIRYGLQIRYRLTVRLQYGLQIRYRLRYGLQIRYRYRGRRNSVPASFCPDPRREGAQRGSGSTA